MSICTAVAISFGDAESQSDTLREREQRGEPQRQSPALASPSSVLDPSRTALVHLWFLFLNVLHSTPEPQHHTPTSELGTLTSQLGTSTSQLGTSTSQLGTPTSQLGTLRLELQN